MIKLKNIKNTQCGIVKFLIDGTFSLTVPCYIFQFTVENKLSLVVNRLGHLNVFEISSTYNMYIVYYVLTPLYSQRKDRRKK